MNRRQFLLTSAACVAGSMAGSSYAAAPKRPSIINIVIDDLGWMDLGCYGNGVIDTPNLDRLAAEGLRFTNAYANCPVCSPSRAAIMTGQYPARLRFTGHITAIGRHRHPDNSLIIPPDDRMYVRLEETSIAEALKRAGYASAHVGKWHIGEEGWWPDQQGFDVNIGGWTSGSPPSYWYPYTRPGSDWNESIPTLEGGEPGEYLTDRLTDESIAFMEAHRDRPFYLNLWPYAVHTPLQAPEALVKKYEDRIKDSDRNIDPVYAAMVDNMDRNVGRVLDALDRLGLTDTTAIIMTSDNGGLGTATDNRPLREGKGYLYEGGTRVPLIVKWPGHVPAGAECHDPVMGADLYPTILHMAGVEPANPAIVDGVDLAPLWQGANHLPARDLYWYYPHYSPQAKDPGAAIIAGGYKLIEFYDPERTELYNLKEDPGENHDLAAAMPDKAAELQAKLAQWLTDIDAKMHTPGPGHQQRPAG